MNEEETGLQLHLALSCQNPSRITPYSTSISALVHSTDPDLLTGAARGLGRIGRIETNINYYRMSAERSPPDGTLGGGNVSVSSSVGTREGLCDSREQGLDIMARLGARLDKYASKLLGPPLALLRGHLSTQRLDGQMDGRRTACQTGPSCCRQ